MNKKTLSKGLMKRTKLRNNFLENRTEENNKNTQQRSFF